MVDRPFRFVICHATAQPAYSQWACSRIFLNPKIAVLYLSLLPQIIDPQHGSVLAQSVVLGATQITISIAVNAVFLAGSIAVLLSSRPTWLLVQRWLMGTVLMGLAVRMATESRR